MTLDTAWPVPFILDPQNLSVGSATAFVVSVFLTVMINAEAQAFAGTLLGDSRVGAKDRFHFNALLHLDIMGTICYLVAGFGWPRTMEIDRSKFARPRLYMAITRLAGPVANLLLASIAGSIVALIKGFESNPRVFLMVVGVNITTAVYNLIPLPPLAAGFLLRELLPTPWTRARWLFLHAAPFIVLALALVDRINNRSIIGPYLDPIVLTIFNYIKG